MHSSCEREEWGTNMRETGCPANTKVSEEGGDRPSAGAEISLQSVGKTMVKQLVILQHVVGPILERIMLEQISIRQLWRTRMEQIFTWHPLEDPNREDIHMLAHGRPCRSRYPHSSPWRNILEQTST